MFKAGDVVRIKSKERIPTDVLIEYWASQMCNLENAIDTVHFIDDSGNVHLTKIEYVWHPEMLELIAKVDEDINIIGFGNLEKENKELKDKIEEYIKLNIEKDFLIKDYEETINELEVKIMSHENIKMNIDEDYDNLIKKYNNLVSKYNELLEHMMEDFI